jgi:CRP/FNR family cyclic AMP-dependent transcriptional regulator
MPYGPQRGHVDIESVLDADPELATGLTTAQRDALRRSTVARVLTVEPDAKWTLPDEPPPEGLLGLLVLEGLLTRDVTVAGVGCPELLGAGDLLRPWTSGDQLIPVSVEWAIFVRARIAILDERFSRAIQESPSIATRLLDRAVRRSHSQATHLAITCLTGVDRRLYVLLWHLASRWGKVTPEGVRLDLPLTHEQLGRLVRSRRQSVSTALSQLADRDLVICPARGRWLLRGEPPGSLERFDTREGVGATQPPARTAPEEPRQ